MVHVHLDNLTSVTIQQLTREQVRYYQNVIVDENRKRAKNLLREAIES